MAGECVVGWVGGGLSSSLLDLLPEGVRLLSRSLPAAVVAVSYASSPVGPFCELSVAVPARLGPRPGLCVVWQLVSVADARLAYRSSWGTPAVVGPSMVWDADGPVRSLRCPSLGLVVRGVPVGPSFPAVVPVRSVQRRVDGPVVGPRRFTALVRWARCEVEWSAAEAPSSPSSSRSDGAPAVAVDADSAALLGALAGSHPGLVMSGLRLLARPARQPAGLWSSLRAPLAAPEPALSVLPGRRRPNHYSRHPHGALSSVG